MKTQMLE